MAEKYLIDTNIFLEVMLSRRKKAECANFLRMLRDGRANGFVTDFSIHSMMIILENFKKREELKNFLKSLFGYRGLKVYSTSIHDEVTAVDICSENKLDLEDAIQYSAALSLGVDAILSLDKHFEDLEIPRKEP